MEEYLNVSIEEPIEERQPFMPFPVPYPQPFTPWFNNVEGQPGFGAYPFMPGFMPMFGGFTEGQSGFNGYPFAPGYLPQPGFGAFPYQFQSQYSPIGLGMAPPLSKQNEDIESLIPDERIFTFGFGVPFGFGIPFGFGVPFGFGAPFGFGLPFGFGYPFIF
ncbi:UNVERIFIED_CONTAM: hypothetical protein Cloal_2741 [Acetivibrio alkalicellulosi]